MIKFLLRSTALIVSLSCSQVLMASKPLVDDEASKQASLTLQLYTNQPDDQPLGEIGRNAAANEIVMLNLPKDLRVYVFGMLDVKTAAACSQVSKAWRGEVAIAMGRLQDAWLDEKRRSPDLLARMHPRTLFQLADQLALQAPLRLVDYSVAPDLNTPAPNLLPQVTQPVVQAFVDHVATNPGIARMMCRRALALDPGQNFRKAILMALILEKSETLQGQLRDVKNEDNAEELQRQIDNMGEAEYVAELNALSEDTYASMNVDDTANYRQEHPPMEFALRDDFVKKLSKPTEQMRIMMALKLLALTGDVEKIRQLDWFVGLLWKYTYNKLLPLMVENPGLPLWVCYGDNPKNLLDFPIVLDRINEDVYGHPSLHGAESFGEYVTTLFPGHKDINLTKVWHASKHYNLRRGNFPVSLLHEAKLIDSINPDNVIQLLKAGHSVASVEKLQCIFEGHDNTLQRYKQVMAGMTRYLDEARYEAEGIEAPSNLMRACVMRQMAEMVLIYNDRQNFHRVEGCLDTMESHFAKDETIHHVEFNVNDEEDVITYNRYRLNLLRAALAMYEGRYDDALRFLEGQELYTPVILIAAKHAMNDATFPKALTKRIGKLIQNTWLGTVKEDKDSEYKTFENKGCLAYYGMIFDKAFLDKFVPAIRHPIVRKSIINTIGNYENKFPKDGAN
jgi:hypothetical protein